MDIVEKPNLDAAWKLFYGDGLTLGEIAEKLGCGIYDLSPWLTAPANRLAMDGAMEWMARHEAAASEIERLRSHFPNPADHRYWEGRYRDEAAEVDRLKAEVERLRSALASDREECAKLAETTEKETIQAPCPDGNAGVSAGDLTPPG